MIWVVLLLLLAAGCIGYLIAQSSQPEAARDPEAEMRAAVDLHAIRRRLEAAELKTAQRMDAARLRGDIKSALERTDDAP